MKNQAAVPGYAWSSNFHELYAHAVEAYQNGIRVPSELVAKAEADFLAAIGCSSAEVYDFVEDFCEYGEPDFEDVLLVTAVRRAYFLSAQRGKRSNRAASKENLPPKEAQFGGIVWLPRIIAKAEAKLRGELPPGVMYGCGGDRPFLKKVNIHPADFLSLVWRTGGDRHQVLAVVQESLALLLQETSTLDR